MRAVIYARVSTEEQAQRELSIPSQIDICKKFATQNGYEVIDIFIDAGKSGTTSEREAFQELIAQAKKKPPPFNAILVYNYSRFSRNEMDSIVYEELLERQNIKLISVTQPLPEDNAIRGLVRGIFRVIDNWYALNASQEARRGQIALIKQGYYCGGTIPYGYTLETLENGRKKLVPDPKTAPVVQRIFEMVASQYSYNEIIAYLTQEGIKPPKGMFWRKNTISNIIHSPVYKGDFVYGRRAKKHKKRNSKENWIIIENTHEPLVSRDLWERVQRTHKKPEHIQKSPALLGGLVFCSQCGSKMWYRKTYRQGKQYGNYICANREESKTCDMPAIAASIIEPFVINKVIDILLSNDIDTIIENVIRQQEENNEIKKLIQEKTRKLEQVYRTRKNLLRSLEILDLTDKDFIDINMRLRQLTAEEEELKRKIEEYQQELALMDIPDKEVVRDALVRLKASANSIDINNKEVLKDFLHIVISKIFINTKTKQYQIILKIPSLDESERGKSGSPYPSRTFIPLLEIPI